jgi:hypothetical protein
MQVRYLGAAIELVSFNRRNLAALSYRISRFCAGARKGAVSIAYNAAGMASGQTIWSDPNMTRFPSRSNRPQMQTANTRDQ